MYKVISKKCLCVIGLQPMIILVIDESVDHFLDYSISCLVRVCVGLLK